MDFTDGVNEEQHGFWRKQVAEKRTRSQLIYDILFGIIAPVFCFWFDPVVFQGGILDDEGGVFARDKLFVYLLSVIALCTLVLWLCLETHLNKQSGIISGIFLAGALFTSLLGLLLLPLSLLGISFYGLGFLGFIPFFTAFVYWRNGFRAFKLARAVLLRWSLVGSILLGMASLISIPAIVNYSLFRTTTQALQIVLSDNPDPKTKEQAIVRLNQFGWYIDSDEIVIVYRSETDERRKERLAEAYQALRNQGIEQRIARLTD